MYLFFIFFIVIILKTRRKITIKRLTWNSLYFMSDASLIRTHFSSMIKEWLFILQLGWKVNNLVLSVSWKRKREQKGEWDGQGASWNKNSGERVQWDKPEGSIKKRWGERWHVQKCGITVRTVFICEKKTAHKDAQTQNSPLSHCLSFIWSQ